MPLLASLLVALGPGALHFLGDEGCPETGTVESQLRRIAPAAFSSKAPQLALIELHPRGLRVRLFDGEGRVLEDRLLEGSRSCAEWTKATAALLASWESEIGVPDLLLADLPAESTPSGVETALKRRSGPSVDLEFGVGPSVAIAGDGSPAFAGQVLLGLSPHGSGWGGQLGGFTTATVRSVTVAGSSARWQRYVVSLGPYGTLVTGALHVDLGADFLVAQLSASGVGFSPSSTASSFDAGLDVTVRLRWDFYPHWRLWLRAGPSYWPKTEHVQVFAGESSSAGIIPSIDLLATLGISFTISL